MAQRIRKQRNRKKVKGVAVRKNTNQNAIQKIEKVGGGVRVVSYEKPKKTKKKKG